MKQKTEKELLDEYEAWKEHKRPWPDPNKKTYWLKGIELGRQLLERGCKKDREGLDVQETVASITEQLRNLMRAESERG